MSIINSLSTELGKLYPLFTTSIPEILKRFNFAVQIDGENDGPEFLGGFEEVQGIEGILEVRTINEGGAKGQYTFPRMSTNSTIRISRGMTYNKGLWQWFDEVRTWTKGEPDYRRTLSILMLDHTMENGEPVFYDVWGFNVYNAWPVEWHAPSFKATDEEFAFESIVIQYGGLSEADSRN